MTGTHPINHSLEELVTEMKITREKLDGLKAESSALQKKWDDLRKVQIPNKMEELNLESARVADVGNISLQTDAYCTVLASKKALLQEWLEAHDHGDLVTETINASTLKAFMKEQIMAGNEIPPEEIVNFLPFTYATITK